MRSPRGPRTPLRRGRVVLLALAGALGVLATTTATWVTADLGAALVADRSVDVTGATAAPLVPAVALVALAASAATSIAGRVGRVVAGLLLLAAGVASLVGAAGVLVDPGAAAQASVEDVTGGTAAASTAVATVWPWVSCLPSLVVLAAGLLVLVARWGTGRRFDPAPTEAARGSADRVDPGTDPAPGPAADPDTDAATDPATDWDALSRGDDPTVR